MLNIAAYINLQYIQSNFVGCLHYCEEYEKDIETSGHTRMVHFYFRNVNDAMTSFEKTFKILECDNVVCFRRRFTSVNTRPSAKAAVIKLEPDDMALMENSSTSGN